MTYHHMLQYPKWKPIPRTFPETVCRQNLGFSTITYGFHLSTCYNCTDKVKFIQVNVSINDKSDVISVPL